MSIVVLLACFHARQRDSIIFVDVCSVEQCKTTRLLFCLLISSSKEQIDTSCPIMLVYDLFHRTKQGNETYFFRWCLVPKNLMWIWMWSNETYFVRCLVSFRTIIVISPESKLTPVFHTYQLLANKATISNNQTI